MIECVRNVFRKKMTEVLLSFTLDVCVFDQRERISSHQEARHQARQEMQ